MVTLNSGAIINMAHKAVEFTITAGGWPFEGAKETITALHRMGVPTFIASGDRVTKLEKMADHFGIPRDRVYGVATPTVKAQIVHDLRQEYDRVLMVGDGINDLCCHAECRYRDPHPPAAGRSPGRTLQSSRSCGEKCQRGRGDRAGSARFRTKFAIVTAVVYHIKGNMQPTVTLDTRVL